MQNIWVAEYSVLACSRNFGKSFLASVFMLLKWLLFEGQAIYIIGSVGSQSIECFKKLEDIALQRIQSIKGLKDIIANETVKSPACKTGFIHNPSSHSVKSYNDSGIFTLNGDPNNIRSKRASLVFFDESAFSDEELLVSGIAFATQNTDFQTSTEDDYDPRVEKLKCPTQLLFASSMNDTECLFYKKFQDYALKMFMGDKRYFVTSMPCDLALKPYMDGKPFTPLLKQSQIDDEMRVNQSKALREYFNKPSAESEDQMVRNSTIIRNSTFLLPELQNEDNQSKYILACDPARVGDGSIISAMKICWDEKVGIYGEVVNCTDMVDLGKKKKMSVKQPDQIKMIQANILAYNGINAPDYENIEEFLMDAGAGGGASGYADNMLDKWYDKEGNLHKGFIDDTHDTYKEDGVNYPDASRKFKLINPKKYRMQMCEELLELINLDLIKFPKEYNGKDYILLEETNEKGEVEIVERKLSIEERVALVNIDAMKSELLGIHTFRDKVGNVVSYANPNQHAKDDRFYTLLLLAHKLYEIRRKNMLKVEKKETNYEDYLIGW